MSFLEFCDGPRVQIYSEWGVLQLRPPLVPQFARHSLSFDIGVVDATDKGRNRYPWSEAMLRVVFMSTWQRTQRLHPQVRAFAPSQKVVPASSTIVFWDARLTSQGAVDGEVRLD